MPSFEQFRHRTPIVVVSSLDAEVAADPNELAQLRALYALYNRPYCGITSEQHLRLRELMERYPNALKK